MRSYTFDIIKLFFFEDSFSLNPLRDFTRQRSIKAYFYTTSFKETLYDTFFAFSGTALTAFTKTRTKLGYPIAIGLFDYATLMISTLLRIVIISCVMNLLDARSLFSLVLMPILIVAIVINIPLEIIRYVSATLLTLLALPFIGILHLLAKNHAAQLKKNVGPIALVNTARSDVYIENYTLNDHVNNNHISLNQVDPRCIFPSRREIFILPENSQLTHTTINRVRSQQLKRSILNLIKSYENKQITEIKAIHRKNLHLLVDYLCTHLLRSGEIIDLNTFSAHRGIDIDIAKLNQLISMYKKALNKPDENKTDNEIAMEDMLILSFIKQFTGQTPSLKIKYDFGRHEDKDRFAALLELNIFNIVKRVDKQHIKQIYNTKLFDHLTDELALAYLTMSFGEFLWITASLSPKNTGEPKFTLPFDMLVLISSFVLGLTENDTKKIICFANERRLAIASNQSLFKNNADFKTAKENAEARCKLIQPLKSGLQA